MSPVVVLGGFLCPAFIYRQLRRVLAEATDTGVRIVTPPPWEWLLAGTTLGWSLILRRLHRAVRAALEESEAPRVTLVGHSAGGVIARLYLAPEPFRGDTFDGQRLVDRLITLGSPHHVRRGPMRSRVGVAVPGVRFAPPVRYVAIAGSDVIGSASGRVVQRLARCWYAAFGDDGETPGDGLVPVSVALLRDARHLTLPGVRHAPWFGGAWYGSREVVTRWWQAAIAEEPTH
jgi:pimeloyl-ACP methyl ester carboxylesterase